MTSPRVLLLATLAVPVCALAQTSGNNVYGQRDGGHSGALQQERAFVTSDTPPTPNGMLVDAHVLINVKADEYVAVFSIARDGTTAGEASQKMTATIQQFTTALKALHIRESDLYVDFITQPKIYRYDVTESNAKEVLAGFELKKNISIHYTDRDLIDQLVAAATDARIYDLIKVDYIVKDIPAVEARLLTEAAAVIKEKLATDEKLFGIKTSPSPQVFEQRTAIHYPTDLYDSYAAAEGEVINRPRNFNNYTVEEARKTRTFFFNGLDGNGFDKVLNPVLVEPVVQFTLYLKLKYEVAR